MELYNIDIQMGIFNDTKEDNDPRHIKDIKGDIGPPGIGFKLTNGNYDMENKKLINVALPTNKSDAINKEHLDLQFTPVMMTRNVFSKGVSMQNARIEGLAYPNSVSDAVPKSYIDSKINDVNSNYIRLNGTSLMTGNLNMNNHNISNVKTPNGALEAANRSYVDRNVLSPSIHTINLFDSVPSGDYTPSNNISVFLLENTKRDFTKAYHYNDSHIVCSLSDDNPAFIKISLGRLNRGLYILRSEFITSPKSNEINILSMVGNVNVRIDPFRTLVKAKYENTCHMETHFMIINGLVNSEITINFRHKKNDEIAIFLLAHQVNSRFGRIDKMILENKNWGAIVNIRDKDGNMDMKNKKLVNVANGTDPLDSVNRRQLDEKI